MKVPSSVSPVKLTDESICFSVPVSVSVSLICSRTAHVTLRMSKEITNFRAGEKDPQLQALTLLAEDLSSITGPHVMAHNHLLTPEVGDITPFPGHHGHQAWK